MAKIMMVIVMRNEDDHHDRYVHLRCKNAQLSRDQAGDCGGDDEEDDDHGDGDRYKDDHHNKMVLTIKLEGQAAEFTSGVRHGFSDQQNVLRHSRELLERRWEDNINLPFTICLCCSKLRIHLHISMFPNYSNNAFFQLQLTCEAFALPVPDNIVSYR